jgi:hypothetical protein
VYMRMCVLIIKAHADGHCCEAIHLCAYVCAYDQGCMCIYVHVCRICSRLPGDAHMYVYECVSKVYAHCDCCEAMQACVRVCLGLCRAHAHTVIGARRCMHVSDCVLSFVQGACSL